MERRKSEFFYCRDQSLNQVTPSVQSSTLLIVTSMILFQPEEVTEERPVASFYVVQSAHQ